MILSLSTRWFYSWRFYSWPVRFQPSGYLLLVAVALLLMAVGCGGGSSPADTGSPASATNPSAPSTTDATATGGTAVTGGASDAVASSPDAAPGTLQLPDDFDPATVPQAEADPLAPASKDRGFALPPLDESAAGPTGATRTAQRYHFTAALADDEIKVDLRAADWAAVKAEIAKAGRITVVDIWSLACEPCLKEFPGLVKIDRELGKSVACLAVNTDFDGRRTRPAESYRQRVEAFLQSTKATFPNFLSTTASDEVFETLEIESIPAVLIFDAEGKLIRKFVDAGADAGFTYDDHIVPFVKNLL